jgi:hypothetical protein
MCSRRRQSSPNERPQAHNTVTGEKRQCFNYYYLLLGQLIRLNMQPLRLDQRLFGLSDLKAQSTLH